MKEDLLFRMAWYFDRNYTDWTETQDMTRNRVDLLHDYVLYSTEAVENSRYKSFLPALYGFQVMTEGNRYIMDERREYFQFMYKLLSPFFTDFDLNHFTINEFILSFHVFQPFCWKISRQSSRG